MNRKLPRKIQNKRIFCTVFSLFIYKLELEYILLENSYNNNDILEEAYGINLLPFACKIKYNHLKMALESDYHSNITLTSLNWHKS